MPSIRIHVDGECLAVHPLFKKVTSIGRSKACDITIADPQCADTHCHIYFDGRAFRLVASGKDKVHVNDKRRRKHDLAHRDRITLGRRDIIFCLHDEVDRPEIGVSAPQSPYRALLEFSSRLLTRYALDELLDELMAAVLSVSRANKGFLVLFEDNRPRIKVARNTGGSDLDDAVEQLSDSIIAKVVRTRNPLLVPDALGSAEFSQSKSVIDLKVVSVMCVPLVDQDALLGLIYVASDQVGNLFDASSLDLLTVFAAQASLIIANALLVNALTLDKQELARRLESLTFGQMVGACDAMREVYRRVEKIAATDVSVLITGETGTGKELIAAEIHQRSPRSRGPFISINCGAIPEQLLESELFGHVKGAFTGAVANRRGRFQAAHGGTLFLDEIGDLPLQLQVKLLRAIQDKAIVRVGETRVELVDIRIIAATNRTLSEEIANGGFREDLYYRLNVINVHLPPLRARGDDVMVIAKYLLDRFSQEFPTKVRGFSPGAVNLMKKYDWPGNIRQLENHIRKAVILAEKPLLSAADMGLTEADLPPVVALAEAKEAFQRRYIDEVLARNGGNRSKAARDLGVDPRTIFRHLEKEDAP